MDAMLRLQAVADHVLNQTCEGEKLAQHLVRGGVKSCVAWKTKVRSDVSKRFAVEYISQLLKTSADKPTHAYEAALVKMAGTTRPFMECRITVEREDNECTKCLHA